MSDTVVSPPGDEDSARPSPPSMLPPPPPPPPQPKEMPLPPKFPSIHDEPAWTSPHPAQTSPAVEARDSAPDAAATADAASAAAAAATAAAPSSEPSPKQPAQPVSWNRDSSDNLSPSLSQQPLQPDHASAPHQQPGMLHALLALFKPKAQQPAADAAQPPPPSQPPLQKVKHVVCKLPDPTLIFVLQASLILLLHSLVPHVLRSWPARIVVPLLLVPTVGAAALWRRTVVIAKPGRSVLSVVKPIPNAGKVVSMGQTLRAREAAVITAEQTVRDGQVRLEILRKEIEARLPPQDSITTLLASDNRAQQTS